MKKCFLDEQQLLLDSFELGVKIVQSGFRPSFIVGLWRGGSTVGIYVQECLQTLGIQTDHIAIRTSYRGARVHGTEYLLENLNANDGLLIVDDVFSTGLSIQAVLQHLKKSLRLNFPREVKVATLYQRPSYKKTEFTPDYCLRDTADWLVFPYEMSGLTPDEIREHKPYLSELISQKPLE
jgi:hypoxanthine phosphoribosyltransferase